MGPEKACLWGSCRRRGKSEVEEARGPGQEALSWGEKKRGEDRLLGVKRLREVESGWRGSLERLSSLNAAWRQRRWRRTEWWSGLDCSLRSP